METVTYFLVGRVPVRSALTGAGRRTEALDLRTGEFCSSPRHYGLIRRDDTGLVQELSEAAFAAHVAAARREVRPSLEGAGAAPSAAQVMSHPRITEESVESMLHWLEQRGMTDAAAALRLAAQHHTGVRRGPQARPEITHQVQIMQLLRALVVPDGTLEKLLTVAALHDLIEDYPVDPDALRAPFGPDVSESVRLISRTVKARPEQGTLTKAAYFAPMDAHPRVAAVKAADRVVNQRDMVLAFKPARQLAYLDETRTFILPMLERAWTLSPAWRHPLTHLHDLLTLQEDLLRPGLTAGG